MDINMTGHKPIPNMPSWIEEASEDDPIYKRGFVFGGTYSRNSSKSTPETTSQESKEPLTIEEAYEEAALRLAKEKAPKLGKDQ